jgi:NAD(P)-dependent dehydrogenase (short-subunit alcohol dehydrogenase family)
MRIEGAVAIVAGGGSGLGEATARRLAAAGATVVVGDLDAGRATEVAKQIDGVPVGVNVTDGAAVEHLVAEAQSRGPVRIAVNCAGIGTPTKLVGREGPTPLAAFAQVIDVNLLGTINVLRCAAAAMIEAEPGPDGERGVCVNTASVAGYEGQVGQVAYAASKAGVIGLTLPVARELAPHGVRVVTIAPGPFETPMVAGFSESTRASLAGAVPFPSRLGDPDEYASLVGHVVTNRMLNGEVIRLDGALRMASR